MRTDAEISKALALAIGHTEHTFITAGMCLVYTAHPHDKVRPNGKYWVYNHRVFDYRDWNVIGPIAERYDAFPVLAACNADQWVTSFMGNDAVLTYADTPQKAIALAVISAQSAPQTPALSTNQP